MNFVRDPLVEVFSGLNSRRLRLSNKETEHELAQKEIDDYDRNAPEVKARLEAKVEAAKLEVCMPFKTPHPHIFCRLNDYLSSRPIHLHGISVPLGAEG